MTILIHFWIKNDDISVCGMLVVEIIKLETTHQKYI